MTVAEKLKDRINYSLMVNHDSIEVSDKIFVRGSDAQKEFNTLIREAAFTTAIKHDVDMIFTLVVAYDLPEEKEYINKLRTMFEATGGNFYFVELIASIETRLERNITLHRLESKESKKDIEWSTRDILKAVAKYRLNSDDDEFVCPNHIKINNENLEPEEVVEEIIKRFSLEPSKKVL